MATRITGRRWKAMAAVLAAASGMAAHAVALASPAAALPGGTEYVNLGDSVSAGSGVAPIASGQLPQCWQSEQNFAHIVAAESGYRLTDVSCGGAKTGDFYQPQYPGTRAQLDALSPSTELVTVMIGGNNNDTFAGAMATCIGAWAVSPGAFDPCKSRYGAGLFEPITSQTYPALVKALEDVHARAPRAHVVVVGYPWLLPATGGCFPQFPIAQGDVPYLRDLQATLNDAIARAAAETGTSFVDMARVSEGHDGCKPVGERWIEPLVYSAQPVPVHPNADGERALAREVAAVIANG
ncbi:SGNH/GDSL hydrolase family protein [Rhodococcus sp. W8901]|uniref:SGNH/GDSL hydrolase family protein n=1 Tax=Rhodococcus sp. W8901 TaxID=2742603 RepID=UPI001583F56D|nr:SGNH/GDSL hydrolase family protein [Rhodococcus sp. W8901]QKT12047.1 SGNH/GDSL hydrolase family protein [Rhodococcus sp. W8901]